MRNIYIKQFHTFIGESKEDTPIFPSHEEIEELYWFKKLSEFVTILEGTVKCGTGRKAYANGTRSITIKTESIEHLDGDYIIYPKKGTILYRIGSFGGGSINKGLPFNSIQDWNTAVFEIYSRFTSDLLRVSRPSFKKALINKDVRFFLKIESDELDIPVTAILKILELIASKKEIDEYAFFDDLGLL